MKLNLLLLFGAITAMAQMQTIRATMTGGGGDGKCTFEVQVDGVAEVEIHGDTGTIRQLSGQRATWRRLTCNQPLPNNPGEFRFQGVDGRGRQQLVRDPNSSGGVAVIRIEDPQGGSEGYTGDITWRTGNSNWGGTGNWSGGRPGQAQGQGQPWGRRISSNEAMNICRDQVMQTRGVQRNRVSVRLGNVERDGDSTVQFSFTNGMGRTNSGFCNISGSGQITQFQMEGRQDRGRVSLNQALESCQDETARQLGVGRENVRVQHGMDPGNGSFLINYQAQDRGQRIRTGTCRISAIGELENFRR
jgi:hypothetical protein